MGTTASCDTTVECDSTVAACDVTANCVTTIECGAAAVACRVTAAKSGIAVGCVTTTGCTRVQAAGSLAILIDHSKRHQIQRVTSR